MSEANSARPVGNGVTGRGASNSPTANIRGWIGSRLSEREQSHYERFVKRPLDLVIAVPAAIVTVPVLALAAVLIKVDSPGPVLFRQARVGRGLTEFTTLKLRTMREGNAAEGQVLADNPDVTRVGRGLRRLKIDELPQLYNVILGDMSLVGPRPFLPQQIQEVDENGRYRFLVRPGLTGLAQTNGNVALSWPQRWRYDRAYVERVTLKQDLAILAKTALVVLVGEQRWKKAA